MVESPLRLVGRSGRDAVIRYRLRAGGRAIAEGAAGVADPARGVFETVIEFDNTCCIEMTLEVFEISADDGSEIGLVVVPLAFPERE